MVMLEEMATYSSQEHMTELKPQWISHSFLLSFIFIFSLSFLLDSKFLAKEFWLSYDYMANSGPVTGDGVPTKKLLEGLSLYVRSIYSLAITVNYIDSSNEDSSIIKHPWSWSLKGLNLDFCYTTTINKSLVLSWCWFPQK